MSDDDEIPSGLPEDVEESEPLGVSDAEPDKEAPDERRVEDLPGISTDEPDVSG